MRRSLLFGLLILSGCGALTSQNTLPTDGPIPNPAIEAGATQAQGALSSSGEGSGNLADQPLVIEIDDEVIEITDLDQLDEAVNMTVEDAAAVEDCQAVLDSPPSDTISRCSYDPDGRPIIFDSVGVSACVDGRELFTLNRPSGEGAFVGISGSNWVELDGAQYSLATVDLLCSQ